MSQRKTTQPEKGDKTKQHYLRQVIIGLLSGVLNGLFGAGGGSAVVPAMEYFLKMEEKRAHATAIAIILVMSVVSAFVYVRAGHFDFGLWVPVTIGGVAGGLVGAKALSKIPKRWLNILFGAVIIVTALKMTGIWKG